MKKKLSLFVEENCIRVLDQLAQQSFRTKKTGSRCLAFEAVMNMLDIEAFHKAMCKHHARELNHHQEVLGLIEEKRNERKEIIEHEAVY